MNNTFYWQRWREDYIISANRLSKIEKTSCWFVFLYLILSFYYGKTDTGQFKQCVHSDIKTYLDENKVSSLAEANTMTDDYALTHIFRWNIVPNWISYVQNRFLSYNHLDKPKSNSFQKNENSDKCPELNKECTWLPKSIPSCSYFKKNTLFKNVVGFLKGRIRINRNVL